MSKKESQAAAKEPWRKPQIHMVRALRKHEKILKSLTEDELLAFNITLGNEKPDDPGKGPHTREWACKVMNLVGKSDITGKFVLFILREKDLKRILPYADRFLPPAERGVKLSGDKDADPIRLQHEESEFVRSLMEDASGTTRGLPGPHEQPDDE